MWYTAQSTLSILSLYRSTASERVTGGRWRRMLRTRSAFTIFILYRAVTVRIRQGASSLLFHFLSLFLALMASPVSVFVQLAGFAYACSSAWPWAPGGLGVTQQHRSVLSDLMSAQGPARCRRRPRPTKGEGGGSGGGQGDGGGAWRAGGWFHEAGVHGREHGQWHQQHPLRPIPAIPAIPTIPAIPAMSRFPTRCPTLSFKCSYLSFRWDLFSDLPLDLSSSIVL